MVESGNDVPYARAIVALRTGGEEKTMIPRLRPIFNEDVRRGKRDYWLTGAIMGTCVSLLLANACTVLLMLYAHWHVLPLLLGWLTGIVLAQSAWTLYCFVLCDWTKESEHE